MEFVTSHKWHLLGAIGSAVLLSVGVYLCYMYWPAVASVGVAISQKCLQMVEKVQSILKKWFPAIAVVFIGYLNMVPLFGNRCEWNRLQYIWKAFIKVHTKQFSHQEYTFLNYKWNICENKSYFYYNADKFFALMRNNKIVKNAY